MKSNQTNKITIANDYLQAISKRLALVTFLIPFLGTIVAIGLLPHSPYLNGDGILVLLPSKSRVGTDALFEASVQELKSLYFELFNYFKICLHLYCVVQVVHRTNFAN